MSVVHHVTSAADFQNLISSNTYVLADFYADWCPPCKAIAPVFEQLASSHGVSGKFAFAKVNVDELQDVAGTYGVTAMPTFILFHNEGITNSIRGANPTALKAAVQEVSGNIAKQEEAHKTRTFKTNERSGPGKDNGPVSGTSDTNTISGNYTMTSGARSDWKMSLRG